MQQFANTFAKFFTIRNVDRIRDVAHESIRLGTIAITFAKMNTRSDVFFDVFYIVNLDSITSDFRLSLEPLVSVVDFMLEVAHVVDFFDCERNFDTAFLVSFF